MADMAASVLARLKKRQKKVEEVISFVYSFFARRSFCVVWQSLNMLRSLY